MAVMHIESPRMWQLLIAMQLVSIPYYVRLPPPIIALILLLTACSVTIIIKRYRMPGTLLRLALLVPIMASMILSFGTLLGRDAGTAFLILLSFMKLFEIKAKRDVFIVIYICYFLLASNFFFTQDPWTAPYVFIVVIYLVSIMMLFSDRLAATDFRQRMRLSGRMILQALPLMLILFVLFPRIPGPLWGLPKDATTATTGLSEDMSPGSLSSLILSDKVAFRVQFRGEPPPHQQLYWRGPVFSHYDGQKWTAKAASVKALPNLQYSGDEANQIEYLVTLEPHQRQWLFALEQPISSPDVNYRLSRELQLYNDKKITTVIQYSMVSDSKALNLGLFTEERQKNLQLPGNLNPQTIELAQRWKTEADGDPLKIIQLAMRYFNIQPFVYTLNPTVLGNDAMDDFLFETRRGFCEHYSSAFVYLMRAAGIPARIVTGYQGGEPNPVDDYMIVRQSSAHAWAEVWLGEQGWVRQDPTAAVSPSRIESGIQDAILERDLLPAILISNSQWLINIRYQWDSFNHKWTEWVIGFNQKKQIQLFTKLGFKNVDWQKLVIWLVISLLITGSIITWWVIHQGRRRYSDPIHDKYDSFCRKLARVGISRKSSEGPQEFLHRIKQKLPNASAAATRIIEDYLAIRYGDDTSRERARYFIQSVNAFSVRV